MRQKHLKIALTGRKKIIYQQLLKTLAYSDIFDYPLTGDQLFNFLGVKTTRKDFFSVITTIPHIIVQRSIYYFLPKREKIVMERLAKEKISFKKMQKVKRFAKILQYIPTIAFVGISGSLALMNADTASDSDIFIITRNHTVWLTRFFVYILLIAFSLKKNKIKSSHAICANMFMSESAMAFSPEKRNLYTAHEIIQIVPLVNKNRIFERFLYANRWIKKYFPNVILPKKIKEKQRISFWTFLMPLEYVFWIAQNTYMKEKITNETIHTNFIAFHPIDYQSIILKQLAKREKQYGV